MLRPFGIAPQFKNTGKTYGMSHPSVYTPIHLPLHPHMRGVGRKGDWEEVTTPINIKPNKICLKINELIDWIY